MKPARLTAKCHSNEKAYAHGLCKKCYSKDYHKKHYRMHEALYKERRRQQYLNNKEECLENSRRWYRENKDRHLLNSWKFSISKFGLSAVQYELMLNKQGHSCAICKKTAKENGKRLCVDHCHKSGRVRGLLCSKCNKAMGALGDSVESMRVVIAYLVGDLVKSTELPVPQSRRSAYAESLGRAPLPRRGKSRVSKLKIDQLNLFLDR